MTPKITQDIVDARLQLAKNSLKPQMDTLRALDDILERRLLTPLFQPIVALKNNSIYGYEALIRGPSDSPLHAPLNLFDAATRTGQLAELELLCRQVSLAAYHRLGLPGKLFLNISPAYLIQPRFRGGQTLEHMHALGISADRVVIELTEHSPTHDYKLLRDAAAHYKSMGFEIAIDDLGAGYAGLRLWSELRPDYVKIDMHFVQGIHEDRCKRQFVHSIQEIALSLNCKVVAEGIETQDEYQAIYDLGLAFGQGYYFARPNAAPPTSLPRDVFLLGHAQSHNTLHPQRTQTADALTIQRTPVEPHVTMAQVADIFYAAENLTSIPVVKDASPIGLVRRLPFMQLYANRYGRELYGKKPIMQFMDHHPLIVDKYLPLEKLSKLIINEAELHTNDDFIITDNGRYSGMGTLLKLLQKITDLQIRNARYANPLTLLPGTVPLNERLDILLEEKRHFAVCYCDLDNFKPFNDVYGYDKGDEVIKFLAQRLIEGCDKELDFVSHIGGDDFICVFLVPDWQERCHAILQGFETGVAGFYESDHQAAGGLSAEDRRGNKVFHPIISLSIGAVEVLPDSFHAHHDISVRTSSAKAMAKKIVGNALFIERRHGGKPA